MKAYIHPTCSTCKKVLSWLDQAGYTYEKIDIRQERPPAAFFEKLLAEGLPYSRMFNSSGQTYRELGLKEKLPNMSIQEQANLLASDGMLIKRPILWEQNKITFGSQEKTLKEIWGKTNEI